ncbi:hypothetical protein [Deinococcus radiopugnans]|uniref:Uncharacterized protein n=1 Tax=Deinococcus radiopugnans ATCC 19172 TaxID=585398 RepID=A0ABR6NQU1_9DEIO|nr:hypothetical protein [Deinococcus radiopugnans]MBB6015819.1 hypothetical protein [Deinococcus radiopugnans ATCC 19172]
MTEINMTDVPKAQRTGLLIPANRSHFAEPRHTAASDLGFTLV